MIIYPDLISHDEMFNDIYKIREITDRLCLEVEGKISWSTGQRVTSMSCSSVETPQLKPQTVKGTSFTNEAYKKYIKDDMKSIKGKLEEQKPERVKPFMTGATEPNKHIPVNFKNDLFFIWWKHES
ncbi:PREDICTED: translationally-controlled tumor protein-like [Chrysochloris asiatica]|uniref:Translationally-controlled tumor protein n=1 Tax=Chrysochloris asiatica TaxID=185453 RepID=A0A9B0X146_CHRAS|nr:PREDICTED: translationally-controlled tumor protein-like [Chrysochloris asiatica]